MENAYFDIMYLLDTSFSPHYQLMQISGSVKKNYIPESYVRTMDMDAIFRVYFGI